MPENQKRDKDRLPYFFYWGFIRDIFGKLVQENIISYETLAKFGNEVVSEKTKQMADDEKEAAEIFINHLQKKAGEVSSWGPELN